MNAEETKLDPNKPVLFDANVIFDLNLWEFINKGWNSSWYINGFVREVDKGHFILIKEVVEEFVCNENKPEVEPNPFDKNTNMPSELKNMKPEVIKNRNKQLSKYENGSILFCDMVYKYLSMKREGQKNPKAQLTQSVKEEKLKDHFGKWTKNVTDSEFSELIIRVSKVVKGTAQGKDADLKLFSLCLYGDFYILTNDGALRSAIHLLKDKMGKTLLIEQLHYFYDVISSAS